MRTLTFHSLVIIVVVGMLAAEQAHAELPLIRFDRIQPLGANVGGTVEVEVLGAEVEGLTDVRFDHPGIKATAVMGKEKRFTITVAADVPEGTYDATLVGRFGASNPRVFQVTHELVDVAEKEPNNAPETAQPIELNSAINGQSDGNDQDVYRVKLTKGQRIVADCWAGRLVSTMDGNLTLTSADGKPLVSNGDYFGRDPLVDFVAPADGEYLVIVSDLSFRGGYPYRLLITNRPQIENVFPRAIQLGQTAEVTLLGRNLPGSKPAAGTIFDLPLEEVKLNVTAPTDAAALGNYTFLEHPVSHTVSPTAATCTLSGWQFRPVVGKAALNGVPMVVSDMPVTLETEPNETTEAPQTISIPAVISGRFDRPRDADWFTFPSDTAGNIHVEVYCERIGGQADPYVVLLDEKGNRVGELDDFGHRVNAFDGHLRDPSGQFAVAAKQTYRLLVQDRYQRGGPRYQYVLRVRRPTPDFYAAAIHSQNPGPGSIAIPKGGTASVDLVVHQQDGFNSPITFTAEGLPPGVHAVPTTMGVGNTGAFVFWADDNAADWAGSVKLFATAKRGDEVLRREVRPYYRVSNDNNIGGSMPTRQLAAAVREKSPYLLTLTPDKVEIEAGKKLEIKAQLTRHWPEFKEKLTCLPLIFPGNFKLQNTEIAAGANEATLSIEVQAGTRPGEYTLAVLGQAQVPYHKNAEEKTRPNTLVSLPSRPVTITVVAPPGK